VNTIGPLDRRDSQGRTTRHGRRRSPHDISGTGFVTLGGRKRVGEFASAGIAMDRDRIYVVVDNHRLVRMDGSTAPMDQPGTGHRTEFDEPGTWP
jgi:hypothetical protein